ncbi:MAG: hypothetical protein K8S00_09955 [Bacteroidales bacterium]|nr:hypothetical protein [Bacteroidales bacterium]
MHFSNSINRAIIQKLVLLRLLILCFILSLAFTKSGNAQTGVKDSTIFTTLLFGSYAYQVPGNDIAKRFGNNSSIGGGCLVKTKENLLFGIDFNFLFSDNVKEEDSLLKDITTSEGYLIGQDGLYAEIHMWERGFNSSFKVGKIFPLFGPNPNSGLAVMVGIGYLQHQIRIENRDKTAPQVNGDYKKGYDRLTAGLTINQFIGYMHIGNNKIVSFFAGIEFTQAWTQSMRVYDFDKRSKNDSRYFDTLTGIKVGWIIPLYKRKPDKYYYY